MKILAEELKNKYSKKEIMELVKYLKPSNAKPKKVVIKDTYDKDIANLFSVIKDNKIRPIISKCMVNKGNIIGTDLDCTIITPNKWNIPQGIYTKQMMELKTYQDTYKENLDEFPVINLEKEGNFTSYNKIELEDALNKTIFSASKSGENLSVNVVRFSKNFITASDTFRLVTNNIKGDLEFSLPLNTSLILHRILKSSNVETVEIYLNGNKVEIYVGDIAIMSRIMDLAFPDVVRIIDSFMFSYNITINQSSKELAKNMKKLYTISKDNLDSENSFIFDFFNKELRAIGTDNKINIPIEFEGDIDMKVVFLNAKFIEQYLNTTDLDCVRMSFHDCESAVKIEDNYYTMPLKMD